MSAGNSIVAEAIILKMLTQFHSNSALFQTNAIYIGPWNLFLMVTQNTLRNMEEIIFLCNILTAANVNNCLKQINFHILLHASILTYHLIYS